MLKHSDHLRKKVEEKLNKTHYGTVESKIFVPGEEGLLDR